jgi:hypothetical protein
MRAAPVSRRWVPCWRKRRLGNCLRRSTPSLSLQYAMVSPRGGCRILECREVVTQSASAAPPSRDDLKARLAKPGWKTLSRVNWRGRKPMTSRCSQACLSLRFAGGSGPFTIGPADTQKLILQNNQPLACDPGKSQYSPGLQARRTSRKTQENEAS